MKIFEVSQKVNVTEATLRYWEKVGIIPIIDKDASGIRNYNDKDINWIEFIACMRRSDVEIKILKEYVKLVTNFPDEKDLRLKLLKSQLDEINDSLNQMKASRDLLSWKIEHYDEIDSKYKFN